MLFISAELGTVSCVSEVPGAEQAAPAGRCTLAPCGKAAGRGFLDSKGADSAAAEPGCACPRAGAARCRTGEAAQRRAGRPEALVCFLRVAGRALAGACWFCTLGAAEKKSMWEPQMAAVYGVIQAAFRWKPN